MTEPVAKGGCLCGAVRYEARGPLRNVSYCHCGQCRRTSGHFVAATAVPTDRLELTKSTGLTWYRSSDTAERGFCARCGSSLFWRPRSGSHVSIMAGTLDGATGLAGYEHIFVAAKGDYYSIDDGLPQFPGDSDAS